MELNEIVQRHPVWAAPHTHPVAVPLRFWQTGLFEECSRGNLLWPKLGSPVVDARTMVFLAFLACLMGMRVCFGETDYNRRRLKRRKKLFWSLSQIQAIHNIVDFQNIWILIKSMFTYADNAYVACFRKCERTTNFKIHRWKQNYWIWV